MAASASVAGRMTGPWGVTARAYRGGRLPSASAAGRTPELVPARVLADGREGGVVCTAAGGELPRARGSGWFQPSGTTRPARAGPASAGPRGSPRRRPGSRPSADGRRGGRSGGDRAAPGPRRRRRRGRRARPWARRGGPARPGGARRGRSAGLTVHSLPARALERGRAEVLRVRPREEADVAGLRGGCRGPRRGRRDQGLTAGPARIRSPARSGRPSSPPKPAPSCRRAGAEDDRDIDAAREREVAAGAGRGAVESEGRTGGEGHGGARAQDRRRCRRPGQRSSRPRRP